MLLGRTEEGLRYAVRQRPGSAVAYCALTVGGGTAGECAGDSKAFPEGTAHFVEHTLFKGTSRKRSSLINSYLDRLGGELNAYTTKEEIVLHATILKEDLRKAADLLLELALDPVFPEKEIEKERGVIIDEIHSYKDTPSDDIYDCFEQRLFASHPLSRLILGTAASVRRIRREHLLAFNRRFFRYDNMVLTLVGPAPEKQMEALAKRLSAKWKAAALSRVEASVPASEAVGALPASPAFVPNPCFNQLLSKHNHQVNCIVGGLAPALSARQQRIASILLCNILGGPATNSILNDLLREKHGWVYSVECAYTPFADTGVYTVSFGCEKENLERCLQLIRREMQRLCEKTLSPRKFARCARQLLGQLAVSADSGEAQALSMGKSMLVFGTVHSDLQDREAVLSLTPEILQEVARRLLAPQNISTLIYQ